MQHHLTEPTIYNIFIHTHNKLVKNNILNAEYFVILTLKHCNYKVRLIMLIPNCTSGKDVYILPRIPLTEGVGQLGP